MLIFKQIISKIKYDRMSYFTPKPSKSEKSGKDPYIIHHFHDTVRNQIRPRYFKVLSIDPGIRTYGIRYEEWDLNNSSNVVPIFYDLFRPTKSRSDENLYDAIRKVTQYLDSNIHIFMDCYDIIVEKQLPHNYNSTRIMQHTITYLSCKLKNSPNLPFIYELDPKVKGNMLGAPKGFNERTLKKWSVVIGIEFLKERNDNFSLGRINHEKKKDDLTDIIIQAIALYNLLGIVNINIPVIHFSLDDVTKSIPSMRPISEMSGKLAGNMVVRNMVVRNNIPNFHIVK